MRLNKAAVGVGIVLIIIGIILAGLRYFQVYDFGFAYGEGIGWEFYVIALIIFIIGIILAAWGYMKKEGEAKSAPAATTPTQ